MPVIPMVMTPAAHLIGPGRLNMTNGRLVYRRVDRGVIRFDLDALQNVYCYGAVHVTSSAVAELARRGVQLAWLSQAGARCVARLVAPQDTGTVLRHRQHCAVTDPQSCLELARPIVAAKIRSQCAAARHFQRHEAGHIGSAVRKLGALARRTADTERLSSLRGIEGAATAEWFTLWAQRLRAPWQFQCRKRRPPTDPVNSLLSLGYTLLLNRTIALIQAREMEVYLGALHTYRPGRPSLACDLIEPFRVPAVDRWVLALCNQGMVADADFQERANSAVYLTSKAFARILGNWECHFEHIGQAASIERVIDEHVERLRTLVPALDFR